MANPPSRERAILVRVDVAHRAAAPAPASTDDEPLEELAALAGSAGAEVLAQVVQQRQSYDQTTLVGAGKLTEIKEMVRALEAAVVILDHDLGGTQQRNLEKALDCKVVDRTQLILDIFARRARTREGQLQVELAQLNYLLPRLAGHGVSMSRLGGGIGTRGPGETKLETDRRHIHRRIRKLERDLDTVRATRGVQRRQRQAVPLPGLALVGYTNAGKSTIFNSLTHAGVLADARMFATLDPTVRHINLPSKRPVVLSDTVGFIRRLPTTLVKAFRATLEEVREATLLLHVVDASSPAAAEHCAHVREVLTEIEAASIQQILVLNKCDLLEPGARDSIARRLAGEGGGLPQAVVSARSGEGVSELLDLIDKTLVHDPVSRIRLLIPHEHSAMMSLVHESAVILSEEFTGQGWIVEAEAPASLRRRIEQFESIE